MLIFLVFENPLTINNGREAASGFDFDQDKIDLVANMMYNAIKSKSLPIYEKPF